MSFYPPPSSHHSAVYPNTPIPSGTFLPPQPPLSQHLAPNVIYVPSRSGSHRSHRSHHSHADRSHHGHQYDDGDDYESDHDRDRYHHDQDRYHHDHRHDRGHRNSSKRHSSHRDRDRDDRNHRRRSRSRRRHHDRAPQVVTMPAGAHIPLTTTGVPVMSSHAAYPGSPYYYRPTWTQRLRQFFGLAPTSPHYRYKSDTHSWGFLGRSRRPRYVDAYTGAEVDKYGRQVVRV